MCNCGNKRNTYIQQQYSNIGAENTILVAPTQKTALVNFQYIGKTALTIMGSITQRRYRFNYPGEVLPIDQRDGGAMMAIPVLKKIS